MAVYFIRDSSGYIKIGTAGDPQKRLKTLQTAHADPLRLLATIPGGPETEDELHQKFGEISMRGEWFYPTERLLGFIEGLMFAKDTKAMFEQLARNARWSASDQDFWEEMNECPAHPEPFMDAWEDPRNALPDHVSDGVH